MKHNIQQLRLTLGQVNQRHVRIGLVVLTVVLFALGAGAPGDGGCC